MKNLSRSNLVYKSLLEISNQDAKLTNTGALVIRTGLHTGRSPDAKFIVEDEITKDLVDWNYNQKVTEEEYQKFKNNFLKLTNADAGCVYIQQVYAGQHNKHKIPVQIYTSKAWQSLFVKNMFVSPTDEELESFEPEFTLYCIPEITADPRVIISFKDKLIMISGTWYAGEMKKSMFTVLNFLYPQKDILPMHCSVNVSTYKQRPISTIFFGLSGTGKTTLSSDKDSQLVGDDEHGWSDDGLFNFEGGCYAKVINLSKKDEPIIYDACQQFGSILENVDTDKQGNVNFNSNKFTENTRASYPLEFINSWPDKVAEHPKNIIMLTCDASGILPPVSKLSPTQAVRQFLLGYTAKVAGTEKGVVEPQPTFSHCFGAPFMPLRPKIYAALLQKKIKKHKVDCWLVNTGWTGGAYGTGQRMPIELTRTIVDLIRYGTLKKCKFEKHVFTDLSIPSNCKVIPENILRPELGWANKQEYIEKAEKLMTKFTNRLKTMHL
jgi:phosphoenolpyruvate carboxykinase (ATP)